MIVAMSHKDTTNLGDLVCAPHLYFHFGDVLHVDTNQALPAADGYIFGGGAMYKRAVAHEKAPGKKVAWGLGQTNRALTMTKGAAPESFDLFGSRDVGMAGAEWVPCVSCMSPLFDEKYEIKHEAVVYLNHSDDRRVPTPKPPPLYGLPTLNNRTDFETAIRFIASGQIVITNSFHGAYWGVLLNRAVVIVDPYSSKFYGYKHQPATATAAGWSRARMQLFPQALEECRAANIDFADKVADVLC